MANPNTGAEKPGPKTGSANSRVPSGSKGKAKHAVGGNARSSRQGFTAKDFGNPSNKMAVGVGKGAIGSGAQNLDPMTKEALRNVGC